MAYTKTHKKAKYETTNNVIHKELANNTQRIEASMLLSGLTSNFQNCLSGS